MSRIYLESGWLEVPWGDGDLGGCSPSQTVCVSGPECRCSGGGVMFTHRGRLAPCKLHTRCLGTRVVSKYILSHLLCSDREAVSAGIWLECWNLQHWMIFTLNNFTLNYPKELNWTFFKKISDTELKSNKAVKWLKGCEDILFCYVLRNLANLSSRKHIHIERWDSIELIWLEKC